MTRILRSPGAGYRRHILHAVVSLGLLGALILLCAPGCAASQRRDALGAAPPVSTSQPVQVQAPQQQGGVNVAAQTDVRAKGIEYRSDLPWKAIILMIATLASRDIVTWWIVRLSHVREMKRLSKL